MWHSAAALNVPKAPPTARIPGDSAQPHALIVTTIVAAAVCAWQATTAKAQPGGDTDAFGPRGANIHRAHSPGGVTGTGSFSLGIVEWAGSEIDGQSGVGIKPANDLGERLLGQWNYGGMSLPVDPGGAICCNMPCRITPPAPPGGEMVPTRCPGVAPAGTSDHATLVANIIAAVAPTAAAYATHITAPGDNEPAGLNEMRAAIDGVGGSRYINVSFGYFGYSPIADQFGLFLDMRHPAPDLSRLAVVAAGNESGVIRRPGDLFNGITVGATDETFRRRWHEVYEGMERGSNHVLPEDDDSRGKPDIVAPGKAILGIGTGTSFSAPMVTGTLALLSEAMGSAASIGHASIRVKAVLLNSARKRYISGENSENATLKDDDTTEAQDTDRDYLRNESGTVVFRNNSAAAPTTGHWTPAAWTKAAGGTFLTTNPLDDELGVGALDAARAVAQVREGNLAGPLGRTWVPDQQRPEPAVPRVGRGDVCIGSDVLNEPASFTLDGALSRGTFITATLCWNRAVTEVDDPDSPDENAICDPPGPPPPHYCGYPNMDLDPGDTYVVSSMPNLRLRIIFNPGTVDEIVAESDSPKDNLEHLHIPVPYTSTAAGKYRIEVWFSGAPDPDVNAALAWWVGDAPAAPIGCATLPGDLNGDSVVSSDDQDPFVAVLLGQDTDPEHVACADLNGDEVADAMDVQPFVTALGG